ncbi:spore wall assembly protein [Schizosaccharomyces japonicus yFS275]|uniref:Spore wall assembly protein n=1 Tax=Schizosaccharomyces japonicus (strain yFS275 / FY16936) TaxID=402676 RepID=B6JX47_SCHJY|nr:spore wall assembly protein [Schizosaccharomyces japonicus yFS275]EEB05948.1 spore wall assembly protein [Schizosaccharomyces japonicus yFS275]
MSVPEKTQEIDVLYENQRGIFFCGIPLFSAQSLLNFDPAPWIDKNMKTSPVSVETAACPDPSWEWAWQRWYVDMSDDVDESGWQYAFSFTISNWHGRPLCCQSFVRRRRWIRKRKKRSIDTRHNAVSDYFTLTSSYPVHTSSLFSPESQQNMTLDLTDATTISGLINALQKCRIDREKMSVLRHFLRACTPQELPHLHKFSEHILSTFVYEQNRFEACDLLEHAARSPTIEQPSHDAADASTSNAASHPETRPVPFTPA